MDFTLQEMWRQMGLMARFVVIVLGLMSVITVAVTGERLITYRRARARSRAFAKQVQEMLTTGKFDMARELSGAFFGSHLAAVVRAALDEFLASRELAGRFDVHGAVKEAVERSTERQMAGLRRGLSALATISSTAPFVGLFGTTFGIINSFQGMAREGGGGLGSVAAGIAEALVTTAVGIGVAIVSVLIYNWFTSQVETFEVETKEASGEVIALLAREQAKSAKGAA